MSNTVKACRCLSGIFLNQSIIEEEFFHWLRDVLFLTSVLILWSICLLIRPISLLAGLIMLRVGFLATFSLWSLSDMKGCRSALRSVRSWLSSSVAMAFASWLIL